MEDHMIDRPNSKSPSIPATRKFTCPLLEAHRISTWRYLPLPVKFKIWLMLCRIFLQLRQLGNSTLNLEFHFKVS